MLLEHLPDHLARQRWSGVQGRSVAGVELLWQEVLLADDPMLIWTVARVRLDDGQQQDYQLFLGVRSADEMPKFLEGKERELVGLATTPDHVIVYDALVDPDLAIEVLHLVAPDAEVNVRRPIVLEHSNSSVVYDEAHILKVLRKVEPGPNPDVEITRVLAARGCEHVLAPLAELRRDGIDLAVLREFLVGSTEGWELARASVRDLLAGGTSPEDSGADFAPDAARLGSVLASLHLAMADAWGRAHADAGRWASEMEADLESMLGSARDALPPELDVDAIAARFRALAKLTDAGMEIRIHGDLHLGQLVKSDAGWKVLDFEGEPARRRDERFTTSSPLRDVAGMLRSLHYAALTGLHEWAAGDSSELLRLVEEWEQRNRDALRLSYFNTSGIADLLPATPEALALVLDAFELDKAVYEVGYERGHRPELVSIPVAGIMRLLAQAEPDQPQ